MPATQNGSVTFFVDEEAVDISRLTGLPWSFQKTHQRGVLRPYLEISSLDWFDKWRVAWAYIGAHYYVTTVP